MITKTSFFTAVILTVALLSCGTEQNSNKEEKKIIAPNDTLTKLLKKDSSNISSTIATDTKQEPRAKSQEPLDAPPATNGNTIQPTLFSVEIQKFKITGTTDTTIFGKEGTRIFIPSKCFVTMDGKPNKDKVDIEIKECYKLGDIMKEKLSTVADSELLETRGMIYIEAKSNNKKLKLKSGSDLIIHFPKKKESKDMSIFYGVKNKDGNINWKIDSKSLLKYKLTSYSTSFTYRPGRWHKGFDESKQPFKLDDLEAYIIKNNDFNAADLSNLFEKVTSLGIGIDFDEKNTPKINIENSPSINFTKKAKKLCETFIANFNKENTDWKPDYDYKLEFGVKLYGSKFNTNKAYKESFRKKYANSNCKNIDNAELSYYIFNATELGWINCDRFYQSLEQKIDFVVKADPNFKGLISIVFKNIKSVMTPIKENNNFIFKNVPINSVINIVAIKQENNKSFLAIQPTTVSETPFNAFAYKKIDIMTLDKELGKIYQ